MQTCINFIKKKRFFFSSLINNHGLYALYMNIIIENIYLIAFQNFFKFYFFLDFLLGDDLSHTHNLQ